MSIAAKLATVALLVVGIYEINETGFLGKLGGIAKVLNLSSSDIPQNGGGKLDFDHHSFSENKSSATASAGHERPNFDHDGRGMERGMNGKESGFESPNPFVVIGTYFAIISVFISVIYYIEKILSVVKNGGSDCRNLNKNAFYFTVFSSCRSKIIYVKANALQN
ncbi:hypothetical protein AAAC51_04405 [Priestia megaterium]